MPDLILHHYPSSPFSEKIRLVLGYKKLAWKSVIIPPIMPKPDVLALTGGYRKTPVLQVGADIYCDSALICDVLEHVQPEPPLYPPHLKGVARVFAQWADTTLFWAAMAYNLQPKGAAHVFAKAPPEAAKAFGEDRKAMSSNMVRLRPARRHLGLPLLPAAHRPHGGGARFPVRHRTLRRRLRDVPLALVHARAGAGAGRHPERHAGGGRMDGPHGGHRARRHGQVQLRPMRSRWPRRPSRCRRARTC